MSEPVALPSPQPWYQSNTARVLLFIGIALAIYSPAIGAHFIWDDDLWIVNNTNLRSLEGLFNTWFAPRTNPEYYPLTLSVFWAEYQLWGLRPTGYHVVNIVLHAINAYLIGLVLKRLAVPGAWLAAAIFLVHPVNVETVAWVTEHKNTLAGILLALSVLAFIKTYRLDSFSDAPWGGLLPVDGEKPAPRGVAKQSPHFGWFIASVAFYVLAVLSKTVAVTLPGALLVILWWKRRLAWRSAVLILPYLALGLPLAVFAVWMQHVHTGASGEEFHLTVVQRLMIASRAPWFYLSKLVWPWPLAFVYPKWELKTWHLVGGAATVGVLIVLWALRNRIGRGPLAAFLIYGGMLLPALGFFNVFWFRYTWVADHVQYHASVAMYALLAAALLRWWPRVIDPPVPLGAWLLTLCLFTVGLSTSYYDNERLMRRTAKFNPHNQFPHGNLGYALHAKGKYAEAAEAFREALKYTPPVPYRVSRAQYWLGHALESDRRFAEAIPPYREAVKADPEYASAHYNLANCLRETRQFEEAADHYRRTIQIEPGHVYAHNNLAFSLLMAGRVDEAIAEYEATLRIAPGLAPAQAGLRQAQLRKQNESR